MCLTVPSPGIGTIIAVSCERTLRIVPPPTLRMRPSSIVLGLLFGSESISSAIPYTSINNRSIAWLVFFGAGAVLVGDMFFDEPELDWRATVVVVFAEVALHEALVAPVEELGV